MTSRADVEQAIHRLGGWYADQHVIDELMAVIDAYAAPAHDENAPEPGDGMFTTLPYQAPSHGMSVPEAAAWLFLGVPVARVDETALPRVPIQRRRIRKAGKKPEGILRKCTTCSRMQDRSEFRKRTDRSDSWRTQCMSCENERKRSAETEKRDRGNDENAQPDPGHSVR